jgi:hypothetical protein
LFVFCFAFHFDFSVFSESVPGTDRKRTRIISFFLKSVPVEPNAEWCLEFRDWLTRGVLAPIGDLADKFWGSSGKTGSSAQSVHEVECLAWGKANAYALFRDNAVGKSN